jgi:hypothetical protein
MVGVAASSLVAAPPLASHATTYDLNLDDPEANLQAFIKLSGSLDTEPVYDIVHGNVYGLVAGQPAMPLFKTVGAGCSLYSRRSKFEYRAKTRYIGMFLDWETEQTLDTWTNPYTGNVCNVPVTRYGPSEVRILGNQILPATKANYEVPSGMRAWFKLGNVAHMQREVIGPAPGMPLFPKADLMTYSSDWEQLADPKLKRIPSRLNFSAVETWREWMNMVSGEHPAGSLWWQVCGAKLNSLFDYPPELLERLLREDPNFFQSRSAI